MSHIGQEQIIQIGGKSIRVARFERAILFKWLEWARKQLPNPLELLKPILKDLDPKVQETMVKDAYERALRRNDYFSPEIQSLMTTPEGMGKLIILLFQVHQPELTDDQAWVLFDQGKEEHGEDRFVEILDIAQGKVPVEPTAAEQQVYEELGLYPQQKKSTHQLIG